MEINDEIQKHLSEFSEKNVVIFNKPTTYFTRLITPMMGIDVIGFSATQWPVLFKLTITTTNVSVNEKDLY